MKEKKQKQIEEMANDLYENRPYEDLWLEDAEDIAKVLYEKGYRKQSENVVELPCKVGDTVWFNTFKKNATVCVGIQPHTIDRIDISFVCDAKNLIETKIPDWQIGKTVFLTKEEAESKLKGDV